MASAASPHDSLTASSDLMSLEQVEARIQQLLQENYDLRNTLQQNNTYMRQLSVTLIEWQEEVIRAQNTYRSKFEKAKDVILKLKEENSVLKQKLALSSTNEDPAEEAAALEPAATAEYVQQEEPDTQDSFVLVGMSDNNKMPDADAALPSYDSLYQQASIQNKEETDLLIKQLQQDSDNLRFQLSAEMESNKNKQILLNNTQEQLDKLMIEFQELSKKSGEINLTKQLESPKELKNEPKETGDLQLIERCSELEKQMALLNARLATAEEIVIVKEAINADLNSEINRLEKLVETVPLLQAQLDLYQSDFEAERDARQKMAGEKDAVCQELRLLKRQLEHTIGAASSASVRTKVESVPTATEANVYECMKCNFNYSSLELLNNHLDVCLNEHMFP